MSLALYLCMCVGTFVFYFYCWPGLNEMSFQNVLCAILRVRPSLWNDFTPYFAHPVLFFCIFLSCRARHRHHRRPRAAHQPGIHHQFDLHCEICTGTAANRHLVAQPRGEPTNPPSKTHHKITKTATRPLDMCTCILYLLMLILTFIFIHIHGCPQVHPHNPGVIEPSSRINNYA